MGQLVARLLAILCTIICATTVTMGAFGSNSDRVLLKDVSALTLYTDRMTAGRRSSPVPQLACVGGTAKGYHTPSVVQCHNRGSDGYDIQWECKADMDNAFRFGSVEVTCEGYDHPDDPFVLRGSCGLEYALDFTEEGHQRYKQQKSQSYSSNQQSSNYDYGSIGKKSKSVIGDLLFLGGVVLVIYIVYKSCLAPSATPDSAPRPQAERGDNPPPYSPPPYGFRDEYVPGSGSDNCHGSSTHHNTSQGTSANNHQANNQGGGFWTGAATGGLMGYLFGRNNGGYTQYQQPYNSGWGSGYNRHHTPRNTGWFSGWGSSGSSGWGSSGGARTSYGGSSSFGGGGASVSSGTRTASGFGGTKRR